jgi:hypothetical protein
MKAAFLCKKTISTWRMLAQSDEVLFTLRAHFIEAVMKMEEKNLIVQNLNTPLKFITVVTFLH